MPTFAVNTFADQTTPAASEAWTVNSGAIVTVAGDYINAASPNPFTGVNTANEGKLLIDGRLVWEIGVANTTNAATGLSITGGTSGATAVITRVGTGLIKFRYANNIAFTNGETIAGGSFSAASNTAPTRSTITYGINAATNGLSVARLGNLEVRGVWRQLGVCTAAANQTLTHFVAAATAGIWVQKGNLATFTNASNQIALQHEFAVGQVLEFATSGSLSGTGFSTGTKYYIVASDWSGLTGQFGSYVSLSTTKTGSAISATGVGSGTISLLATGAIVTFTNGSATITATSGHNRAAGDSLILSTSGSLPGGFDDITTYWVLAPDTTAGTFQLCTDYSPTAGTGTPITATSAGSGTHQIVPDDSYLIWQNIVDRTLTGATAAIGIDLNHGRFFKQAAGSTTITFGDEGAAAAVTFSTTNTSTTLTTSAAHGRAVGDVIRIGNPPTPFAANTDYYVLSVPLSTTLTVSTNLATAAIVATQTQTNTATLLPQIGGKIPAYGAKVRVPNVAIVSTNSGNAPTPIISSFVTIANSVGSFFFDKCITSGLQFNSNNISGFTGRFLTVHNLLAFVYALNTTILQEVAISTLTADSSGGFNILSQNFYFQNIFTAANNGLGLSVTNCLQGFVKGGQVTIFTRNNSNNAALSFSGVNNVTIQNLRYFGAQLSLTNSNNLSLQNCAHSDSILRGAYAAFSQNSFLGSASTNTLIDQLQILAAPRAAVFTSPSSATTIRKIGTSSNPVDLLGQSGGFLTFATADSFNLIDCFWKNTSGGALSSQTNTVLSNVKFFDSGDYGKQFPLGSRLKNIRLKALKGLSFASSVEGSGLHFYDLFASATAGLFGLVFYPKNTDDYFSNLSYTIDADTTPTSTYFISGALQLRTSGNQITYTTQFIQGHTALGAITVTSNNNSNYTFSYDLDAGSGFSGSFTTITSGSSLGASISTPGTGFRLRVRILATATAAANSITALTIATTSTANAQAAIAYPYQASTQVINGLVAGSTVGLFDNTGALVQAGTAAAGSFTFNPIEYFTSANYTIRYRRYGYKEGSIVVFLANGTNTNTIAQVVDAFITQANPATVAAYSNISVGYSPRTLTAGALTQQQIYDFCAYTDALLANIGQAVLLSTADGVSLALAANLSLTGAPSGAGVLNLNAGYNVTLGAASSYTGLAVGISSTGKATVQASTTTLSTWLFATGAKLDNTSASAAIAIVGGTQLANVSAASPTAGGGTLTITLATVNIFSGLLNGSTVALFNSASIQNASTLVESGTVTGTIYTFAAINFTGTVTYSYRVRLYGYSEVTGTITLGSGTVATPISQTVNPFITVANAATVAAYTGIATSNASQTVTQTVTHSRAELFDRVQYNNALLTNIVYALPLTTANGTDLTLTYNYVRTSCALTGTGSLSLPTKTATVTGDSSTGQLPVTDSTGLRFRVYGLPTSGSPVMRSKRVSTSVITNPTVASSGEAYFVIALGEDYQLRADAVGYAASGFITINSNNETSLQITLSQFVDSNGTPVYGQGVAGEKALITFNPSTLVISIAYSASYPTIGLFSAFDKIEELLATSTAIEFTAHPVYSNGTILFPRDIVTNAANPARIQAASGNTGTPTLTFQIVDQASTTPYNLFDFSNGKFINYPTVVNVASGGTALTQQQVRDAAALAPTVGLTPATGSIDSQIAANAPANVWGYGTRRLSDGTNIVLTKGTGVTGFNDITAQSVLSLATSAQTTAGTIGKLIVDNVNAPIASIPTTPLLAADTRLNSLDASIASRPTLAQIEASTVLFKLSNYTAPDNTTIATIGTQSTRVDALLTNPGGGDRFTVVALSNAPTGSGGGGGGLDAAGVRAAIGLASANLDTQLSGLATGIGAIPTTVYTSTLSNILSAINAIPATDLSPVTSALTAIQGSSFSTTTDSLHALRARGDTAWVTGFGSGDRTTLGNIPTVVYTGALTMLQTSVNAIPTIVYTTTLTNILSAAQAIQGKTDQLGFTGSNVNAIALATGGSFPTIPTPPNVTQIRQEMDANSTIATNAKLAKQGVTNRYKIDEDTNTGTLYADDGVTPIVVQVLKDKDGQPASTQTYERVPQ